MARMKTVNDFSEFEKEVVEELKNDLLNLRFDRSYIGSARFRVDPDYDQLTLRVRFNNEFPPQSVKDIVVDHDMVMLNSFVSEEGNLVAFYGMAP